jgi:ribose transport system permease protein
MADPGGSAGGTRTEVDTREATAARHHGLGSAWAFKLGVPATVAVVFLLGALTSSAFLTTANLLNVLTSVSIVGIISMGLVFVVISGGWADLSIPAVMATGGIILLTVQPAIGTIGGFVVALAACAVAGSVNGYLIGYVGANPIITTLGTNIVILGIAQAIVGGDIVYNSDPSASDIVKGRYLGIPFVVYVFVASLLIAHVALSRTVWGRRVFAVGGNRAAAEASGLPTRRVRLSTFALTAIVAGIGGCLLALSLESVRPVVGIGYDFDAFGAIVVGGVSLLGGSGSVARVIGGLFIIQLLTNVMVLHGMSTPAQGLVKGTVIVIAVAVDVRLRRRAGSL